MVANGTNSGFNIFHSVYTLFDMVGNKNSRGRAFGLWRGVGRIMWLLKVKSVATGEYQTIEISDDLTSLLNEADRLVAKGIKIQIVYEKRA